MVIKGIKYPMQRPSKIYKNSGFGLKINHLATLPTYQKMLLLKRFELGFIYKGLISRKVGAKTL
jgi:hypothetical protein